IPLIKKWFGDFKRDTSSRKPMGPEFKPFTQERAIVVTDPEMASGQIQMMNLRAGRPPTVTVEPSRTDLIEDLASWMIARRCHEGVKKGEASYRSAGTYVQNFFNDALLSTGYATGEAKDWSKMLDELVAEANRARQFGFTQHELALGKKEILAEAEHAVR